MSYCGDGWGALIYSVKDRIDRNCSFVHLHLREPKQSCQPLYLNCDYLQKKKKLDTIIY